MLRDEVEFCQRTPPPTAAGRQHPPHVARPRPVRALVEQPLRSGLVATGVLVLGDPDRDRLYEALADVEKKLGRQVQATIREKDWLASGSGTFHKTIKSRPMLRLDL